MTKEQYICEYIFLKSLSFYSIITMKHLILYFILLLNLQVWRPVSVAQEEITKESIQDSVFNQLTLFPQEKIHVQTDRTMYVPGEKIWFKAYVVEAFSNRFPTYSNYVYVELINASDLLVQRVMVKCDDNGLFYGNIFLSEMMPEGDYTLRAYTRYMENLGDDYFFKKPIWIGNIDKTAKQIKKRTDYEVSFFPEGGNFPERVNSRVAFKALNKQGGSESITGDIVNKEGNKVGEVNTVFAGMGSFTLFPESGKEYFLVCKNSNGQEKRFKLPPAQKTYSLQASYRNGLHYIQVKKSPDIPEKPLYLLVHNKGLILYFDVYDYRNDFIAFSNTGLPSGIMQVLLLNERMNPVAERLFYNKNEDQAQLTFSPDKPYYQKREKVTSEISVTDTEGNPLAGHVSIAVTDDKDLTVDTFHTIVSSLLLSSELRGYIESPGYYLQNDKNAEIALDHLMMVHGWRRYDLSEAFKGNYRRPEIEYEEKKEITGSVKSLILRKPVVNCEVISISNDGSFEETKTNSAGLFSFALDYPDSTRFFLQAMNNKGNPAYDLVLKQEQFPKLKHAPVSWTFSPVEKEGESLATDYTSTFMKKAGQRAQYDEGMRIVHLPEVVITETKVAKRDEARLQYPLNLGSNMTIYREEFEKLYVKDWADLLIGVAGVTVRNGVISIRGFGTPLIVIDGNMGADPLSVTTEQIESIDIFKGGNAAIFGVRGANGVISITTRRGSDHYSSTPPNYVFIAPIGYQKPVEFYAPKYDTLESKNLGIPDYRTTIFWKPDLVVSDTGKASFEFYTADFPTTYSVVIEGISDNGKIIRRVEKIDVE